MLDRYSYKNTDVTTANEFWLNKSIIGNATRDEALLLATPTVNDTIIEDIGRKLFKAYTADDSLYTVVARFLKAYKNILLMFNNSELMTGVTALQNLIRQYGLHVSIVTFIVNQHPTTYNTVLHEISYNTKGVNIDDEGLYEAVTHTYD